MADKASFQKRFLAFVLLTCFLVLPRLIGAATAWKPAEGPLATRWAKDVSPENAHPEYPRPQMVRQDWQNLNGLWDYAISSKDDARPISFDGKILVPFPVESALSGVMKPVNETQRLWYRRIVTIPDNWKGRRVLLHFGAVDWETTVIVNGQTIGSHRGGYDGFNFDISDALRAFGDQELVVSVTDPTDAGTQPRGKQVRGPRGIWYTSTTGIWQTAWLEPVPETSITQLQLVPDIDAGVLKLTIYARGESESVMVQASVKEGTTTVSRATGGVGTAFAVSIPNAKLWSPQSPHLYDLELFLVRNGEPLDRVQSYFGMRKIALGKDDKGALRLFLNNQALFQFGPLDQGFWPDGLYTAPTDEALRYDIEMTKKLGFNMARKHVKIEPDRWYYWCDKLGLLVWQDMPSGDRYIGRRDPDIVRSETSAKQFELELKQLIDGRRNHPSIVMWVPFNEGWGQYDTARITEWIKAYDPSRLVNNTSGWADRRVGDVHDIHAYPGPAAPQPEPGRAGVLGEFGGLGLPVPGHTWQAEKNWGYRSFTSSEELTEAYLGLIPKLRRFTGSQALAAGVYTQTTDVEIEVNGLMTYDRELIKMNADAVAKANRTMYLPPPPPPIVKPILPTSEEEGRQWRFTTEAPSGTWFLSSFDDSNWKIGLGGFGEPSTPGSVVRTEWKTADLWIRQTFEIEAVDQVVRPHLRIHHDEDAEVYLNGKLIAKLQGYTSAYEMVPLDARFYEAAVRGKNVMAAHCRQTSGGQYIDAGLVSVVEREEKETARETGVRTRPVVRGDSRSELYVSNRGPLVTSPFAKLPIGSITPRGWLRHQLKLERDGMTGRLAEISPWLKFEASAWTDPEGKGQRGWEEMPYWLKGYGDLGYVLGDEEVIREARKWIEAVMASQREDGWFGPRDLLNSLEGKPDLWPHMVMLNVLQSYYEFSGDEQALWCISRYCRWLDTLPGSAFGNGYWPKIRAGDNIETLYWLYNRTGESYLLGLAKKIHDNMAPWATGVINWHNVNIAQGFREPGVYFQQGKDEGLLAGAERNYQTVMGLYGQFSGGGFAGDENCREGFVDPRQGFETCGIVEFMHSFEMLTKISGNPLWADRCEEIAFNSFPAALTPDWKGLHYLTSANQVQLDRGNKAPGVQNGGTMFSYSPFERYRCCQHNVSHGWPYYAEELWLATFDHGLCVTLYAASEVTARVGDGTTIRIVEETDYPFDDTIRFKVSSPVPVRFPFYFRIPSWCQDPSLQINGDRVASKADPSAFLAVTREWRDGDTVELRLPMNISVRRWAKNGNAVSVSYGPLSFSLKIGERWVRSGGTEAWPEYEVFPTTPWNYGLEIDLLDPSRSFRVVRSTEPLAANPFTPETAPIALEASGRRIFDWELDNLGLIGKLQPSPVISNALPEPVSLVPMGAARLRVTSFPVIGRGANARAWVKQE